MKLALPVSDGRISPVLDFAGNFLLIVYEDGCEIERTAVTIDDQVPLYRARRLALLGTDSLICGAVSRALAEHLTNEGIQVLPFVSGATNEVLAAYLAGQLDRPHFLMPGSTFEDRALWRAGRHPR